MEDLTYNYNSEMEFETVSPKDCNTMHAGDISLHTTAMASTAIMQHLK